MGGFVSMNKQQSVTSLVKIKIRWLLWAVRFSEIKKTHCDKYNLIHEITQASRFKSMSFSKVINSESNQELVNQNHIVLTNPYWYPVLVVVYVVNLQRKCNICYAFSWWLKSDSSAMIILSIPSSTEMDQLSEWISNYYCWHIFNLANWFAYQVHLVEY